MKARHLRKPSRINTEIAKKRISINGAARLLPDLDHRSAPARRYRSVVAALVTDLGGPDHVTEAQVQLARSAAGLVVLRERLDTRFLNGLKTDTHAYVRIAGSLTRVLVALGLKRQQKDVTPSLDNYVAEKYGTTIEGKANRSVARSRSRIVDENDDDDGDY